MGQRMQGRLLVAKDLAGQAQQKRIVADETKPQAVKKGGELPHVIWTKSVSPALGPLRGTKANPQAIEGV